MAFTEIRTTVSGVTEQMFIFSLFSKVIGANSKNSNNIKYLRFISGQCPEGSLRIFFFLTIRSLYLNICFAFSDFKCGKYFAYF